MAVHGGLVGMLSLAGAVVLALAIAALAPGCGSPSAGPSDGGADDGGVCQPFSALTTDFSSYTSWKHVHLTTPFILSPDGGTDLVHAVSPRDVYINLGSSGQPACPPPGAAEFPIGTIIVKVMAQQGQLPTDPGVFAQVKHGCGYNSGGADGWEWFDLLTSRNGLPPGTPPEIIWHGPQPPSSQSYGGDPSECNVCHSLLGADNDSVISTALSLKDFQCE
jgi:hypothetical protein